MELLVVTLVQVPSEREADALGRMRLISDTIRSAAGLLNTRFYRCRQPGPACCLLTTWENVEWWQKARERYDPAELIQASPAGIFQTPPDQWLMRYLWGYSRPRAQPAVATAHLALVRPEMTARVQQNWLESLHRQAVEPLLSFALLARTLEGNEEETGQGQGAATGSTSLQQSTIFFNLLSWPDEHHREDFCAGEEYRQTRNLLARTGMEHTLTLDPL